MFFSTCLIISDGPLIVEDTEIRRLIGSSDYRCLTDGLYFSGTGLIADC